MKWFILSLFLLWSGYGSAQNSFRIKAGEPDSALIVVNGQEYSIDSNYIEIPTNFPAFDTLYFGRSERERRNPIICNFQADSSYTIVYACCMSLDIVPSWKPVLMEKLKYYDDYEACFEDIFDLLFDRSRFKLRIKNGSAEDSIYAWYADHAAFPSFKLIDERGWDYGSPSKGYYWTNISNFSYFRSTRDFKSMNFKHPDGTVHWMMDEDGIIHDEYPDYEQDQKLGDITVRLFGNENYIITYDLKTEQITLSKDD